MRPDALPRSSAAADRVSDGTRDTAEERGWVTRVRTGDREAFEAMYRAYFRSLVGFVYTYLRSEAIAEEQVQELFLSLWRQREHWELRTTLRAYLYQSARNRALNHLKRDVIARVASDDALAEDRVIGMGEAPVGLEQQVEADELAAAIARAVDRLPPRCRTAFTLCRSHGLSYAEVAQVMGISEHTVKIQMTRALKALRLGLAAWLP